MKKNLLKILKILEILLIVFVILFLIIITFRFIYKNIHNSNLNNKEWLEKHTNIILDTELGSDVYSISSDKDIDIYNLKYQNIVNSKISDLLLNTYSVDSPLLIYNPYGTNNLSFNIYFSTTIDTYISYKISVDNISDFSKDLNSNQSMNHQYQIIGFVPEHINTLTIYVKDKDNNIINTKEITLDLTKIKCESSVKLSTSNGNSKEELSNGLYAIFGLDKKFLANTYLYDNNGILRADLVIKNYRTDRIIFYKDYMLYSYKTDGIAKVNKLGKVIDEYILEGYEMHHDYVIDEENNKLLILVNENKESNKTIEDVVISVDLNTKKINKIIDMKNLLPEIYESAVMPKNGKNTYGGTGLDWIHLNSLSITDSNSIVLSSRETSTIIYLSNIYTSPTIKYLINDGDIFKNTPYEKLLLNKNGDFISQAGQHSITYEYSDELENGNYYLIMYNNNYASSVTRSNFNWNNYPNTSDYIGNEKSVSKYYKYLIDENNKTYSLVKEFDLPYSSIVSNVENYDNNYVTSSGKSNCFNEYDSNGILIKQFNYTSKKYAYRVYKYSFNNFWFQN